MNMNVNPITAPIGMKSAVDAVKQVCHERKGKAFYNLANMHYVLDLPVGNGQSTFSEYVAETYFENKVILFHGMDRWLEYRLENGKKEELQSVIDDIYNNAVYDNEYRGIVSMDITVLAPMYSQVHVREFFHKCAKIGKKAVLIFFLGHCPFRKELMVRLEEAFPDILIQCHIPEYTCEDLARIALTIAGDYIPPKEYDRCQNAFRKAVEQSAATTVANLKLLVDSYLEDPISFMTNYHQNERGGEEYAK